VDNAETFSPLVTEITGDEFPIAYVSSIAVGQSENVLLVTFSNYGVESVWQTLDAGATWTNVEGNLPDMPIRWALYHPENDEQVMLATELGVWTTSQLNAVEVAWAQNAAGMANVRVDMLTLRPIDNTVLAATHGRGFFTCNFLPDPTISIPEKKSNFFTVYPNPTNGILNLNFENANGSPTRIIVVDISGR